MIPTNFLHRALYRELFQHAKRPYEAFKEGHYSHTEAEISSLQSALHVCEYMQNFERADELRVAWTKYYLQEKCKLAALDDIGEFLEHLEGDNKTKAVISHNTRVMKEDLVEENIDYCFNNLAEHDDNKGELNDMDLEDDDPLIEMISKPQNLHIIYEDKQMNRRLTPTLLAESANCKQVELQKILRLDVGAHGLTSLGNGIIGRLCPNLQRFICGVNKLKSPLGGAFQGCEKSLRHVSIKDNFLTALDGLESLCNIEVLNLEGNALSNFFPIGEDDVVHKPSTNQAHAPLCLYCNQQHVTTCLQDKIDLKVVDCASCENLTLATWPHLKALFMGFNKIDKLPMLAKLCPNVEVLDLASNQLVTLGGCHGEALLGLRQLRHLDVGQNKLKGDNLWNGLMHCPMLMSLVASRNRLTNMPTHLGNVMLREIWLNGNAIRCLSCKAWLPNLQRLYLQDNLIDTLEPCWGCPSLEVKYLVIILLLCQL